MRTGLLGEFRSPHELLAASAGLRDRGYRRLEAFTPYPVKGLDQALGLRRSPLNWIVLPFAIFGAGSAYLIQWLCNWDYPINVGGRPLNSAPAFIPITFEMGVLTASIVGFIVFLVLSRLPELYSPVFEVPGFERASIDRFWLGVDARDPSFNPYQTERDLVEMGALVVGRAQERQT